LGYTNRSKNEMGHKNKEPHLSLAEIQEIVARANDILGEAYKYLNEHWDACDATASQEPITWASRCISNALLELEDVDNHLDNAIRGAKR
jgi:hypothetical protein